MNVLFIPTTLKVGYQKRSDTYTDKLAYVIYYDEKGKLRKEPSWQGWRNKDLGDDEFQNVPTSGFILNRNGGGTRDYYYWNARAEFVRVWDPRGFEFEISIPNLLFILSHVGCTPGKGLEGEFVYGWNGADLVLLSVTSEDYKKSVEFTTKQSVKIDRKTMVVGGMYTYKKDKNANPLIYMGRISFTNINYGDIDMSVKDVFYNTVDKKFESKNGIADVGSCISDIISDDYADIAVKYTESIHSAIVENPDYKIVDHLYTCSNSERNSNKVWFVKKGMYEGINNDIMFEYYSYGSRYIEITSASKIDGQFKSLSKVEKEILKELLRNNKMKAHLGTFNIVIDKKKYDFNKIKTKSYYIKTKKDLDNIALIK